MMMDVNSLLVDSYLLFGVIGVVNHSFIYLKCYSYELSHSFLFI